MGLGCSLAGAKAGTERNWLRDTDRKLRGTGGLPAEDRRLDRRREDRIRHLPRLRTLALGSGYPGAPRGEFGMVPAGVLQEARQRDHARPLDDVR